MRLRELFGVALLASSLGCGLTPDAEGPAQAVQSFFALLGQYDGDREDAQALHDLLSNRAQKNLATRAARYTAASGKTVAPALMLVPERSYLKLVPAEFRAQIAGEYALVDVIGTDRTDHSARVAQVPCVLEEKTWRLDLALPELPKLPQGPRR